MMVVNSPRAASAIIRLNCSRFCGLVATDAVIFIPTEDVEPVAGGQLLDFGTLLADRLVLPVGAHAAVAPTAGIAAVGLLVDFFAVAIIGYSFCPRLRGHLPDDVLASTWPLVSMLLR